MPTYPMPDPSLGWGYMTNSGRVWFSQTGEEGSWAWSGIPSYSANANQYMHYPGDLLNIGNWWITKKPSGVDGLSGYGQQVAWQVCLDEGGNQILPTNPWTTNGLGWGHVRAIYADYYNNSAIALVYNPGGGMNRTYAFISDQASLSTDSIVWTQGNLGGFFLQGHDIRFAGFSPETKTHIFIARNTGYNNSAFNEVYKWDMTQGGTVEPDYDNWQLVTTGGLNGAAACSNPVWSKHINKWFVGYGSGVAVSDDNAETWTNVSLLGSGGNDAKIYDVATSSSGSVIAVGVSDSSGVAFRSTDAGASWNLVLTSDDIITNVESAAEGIWMIGGENSFCAISDTDGESFVEIADFEDGVSGDTRPNCVGLFYVGNNVYVDIEATTQMAYAVNGLSNLDRVMVFIGGKHISPDNYAISTGLLTFLNPIAELQPGAIISLVRVR